MTHPLYGWIRRPSPCNHWSGFRYGPWQLVASGVSHDAIMDLLRDQFPSEDFSRVVLRANETPYAMEGRNA